MKAVWLPRQLQNSNREFGGKEAETERSRRAESEGFVFLLIPSLNLAVNPYSDSQAPDSLIILLDAQSLATACLRGDEVTKGADWRGWKSAVGATDY